MWLFSSRQKTQLYPQLKNKYGLPKEKDMVEKDMQRRRYEVMAHFVKNRTKTDRPIEDIAAELYQADEKRKGRL